MRVACFSPKRACLCMNLESLTLACMSAIDGYQLAKRKPWHCTTFDSFLGASAIAHLHLEVKKWKGINVCKELLLPSTGTAALRFFLQRMAAFTYLIFWQDRHG